MMPDGEIRAAHDRTGYEQLRTKPEWHGSYRRAMLLMLDLLLATQFFILKCSAIPCIMYRQEQQPLGQGIISF